VRAQRGYSLARGTLGVQQEEHRYRALGLREQPRGVRGKYRTSAKLSAYLARRYNIPVDRNHFVLHRNVPGVNKSCPGRYFDYDKYLRLVRRYK
jgi:hypothetical protein